MKQKILHILSTNSYSGAENVACQIIKMFDNSNYEMAYCSPDGSIADTLKEKNITFYPLKKLSLKEIKRVVREFQPDIVHAHDIKAIIVTSLLSKNRKKIGHVHTNDKHNMSRLTIKSILLYLASKRYKHIFWVSNSCLTDYYYKNKLYGKSSILYNIINVNSLYQKSQTDEKNYDYDIVYLGRLSNSKNPMRLLEIAKGYKVLNNNFKMAIIGDGEYRQQMETKIKEYDLSNNVFMLGFMNNAYKLLSQSKAMLMTSIFEGTPMCALESLALGVPVVSTATDGLVDLIKNDYNGYIYNSNLEAVEFLNKIISKKKDLSNNCIGFSTKYNDIETYKNQLVKAYKGESNEISGCANTNL